MKFHESHTGMFGIWSDVSRQFVFGIQEPSKSKAWKALYNQIGDNARKWRWKAKPIRQRDAHMFKQGLVLKQREVN
ncbi:hypothetical protein SFC50_23090, partial [Bacillus infantis]|uniref:hypothetical protein n=1 Tax=Bacillus infantis TaxID=324767 RepID=UPI003982A8C1